MTQITPGQRAMGLQSLPFDLGGVRRQNEPRPRSDKTRGAAAARVRIVRDQRRVRYPTCELPGRVS
ncbi:hypothetical protein GCM10010467_08950 [Actinocorallia glomerata]|uniref:Uncharacterized protein n=2 Tax=Actinomycetes TaxID=1760 RepID=A0ABP6LUQ8_9MICC